MKVIFTGTIQGVAAKGDVKNVRNGYYRNFLLPRGLAVFATEKMLKEWEQHGTKMMIEREQLKTQFEEMKRRLAGARVKIAKKVTQKGTLYGSLKASDVVTQVKALLNLDIPEEAIVMKHQIKSAGNFDLEISLGAGVSATLPIEIVAKE